VVGPNLLFFFVFFFNSRFTLNYKCGLSWFSLFFYHFWDGIGCDPSSFGLLWPFYCFSAAHWFGLWLCQPVGVWPSMISVLLCVCVCVCVYLWLCEYACVRACGRKTSSHSHLQSPLAPFWLWFYSI
jgi:hypothetical protein